MADEKKLFAFKLAEKKETKEKAAGAKWKARDGVTLSECTDITTGDGDYRANHRLYGMDQGYWC